MTDIYDAEIAYARAKVATDWGRGLVIYADNDLSLSILQPVEFNALEEALEEFERDERAAFEELEHYECEARAVMRQGSCSTPSRYL